MKTVIIVTPDYATAAEYAARLPKRDWLWLPDAHGAVAYLERIEREHDVALDPFWVFPA